MRYFSRFSVAVQFFIILVCFLISIAIAGSLIVKSISFGQMTKEARSVADMVEHIGKWSSQYKGIWVKSVNDDTDPKTHLKKLNYKSENYVDSESYHWKNPALIQREISDIAAASDSPTKFRLTARSVLNKDNEPNEFESSALESLKDNSIKEVSQVSPTGQVLYARKILAVKSCINCHGDIDKAPEFMKNKFPGPSGYGFKEGEVAGIISVTVPPSSIIKSLSGSITKTGWIALSACFAMFLLLLIFVFRGIIEPVNQLRLIAENITASSLTNKFVLPSIKNHHRDSKNEIHRLSISINGLGNSIQLLYKRLMKGRSS